MPLDVIHPSRIACRARQARKPRRLAFEVLEARAMLTWAGTPPSSIPVPATSTFFALDSDGDTGVRGALTGRETDYYLLAPAATGNYSIKTRSSSEYLDTEMAIFSSQGRLLKYSNDISSSDNNSLLKLNLTAGATYYVGITNYRPIVGGGYHLRIIGPPQPTTPTPPTVSSQFQIALDMSGLTSKQRTIFQAAADRWEEIIVGDLPNATYRGQAVDDVLIRASGRYIDGVNGILGQAGPDAFRQGSFLPYHGEMQFDTADMASMERSGLLYDVVLHEMGHVLGIGTIWTSKRLLSGARTNNPTFTGRQATAAYNQLFGTSAAGVPVENTGGSGTRDSHWRESLFTSELMTGWTGPSSTLPISTVTVASLADLGYTVNMAAADSFRPSASARSAATRFGSNAVFAGLIAEDGLDLVQASDAGAGETLPPKMRASTLGSTEEIAPFEETTIVPPPRTDTYRTDIVFARWNDEPTRNLWQFATTGETPFDLHLLLRDECFA